MKRYSILILVLVLTALALAGCRNPNNRVEPTTVPTTQATTAPTVMPTTEATTQPTMNTENGTNTTEHTDETVLPDNVTPGATDATGEGRARHVPRNVK